MGLSNVAIFQALSDKMRWHQARQNILAQNIANADTPNFTSSDLTPFEEAENRSLATITTSTTSPTHIAVSSGGGNGFGTRSSAGFEVTPSGNAVSLEDEMMKVATNDIDYQAVTALYTRSIKLIKTALGRTA